MRFRIHFRTFAQQNIVVLLEGIGLLRLLTHHHLAVEHAVAIAEVNAFVLRAAVTIWLAVVHQGVVIHGLPIVDDGYPVHVALGMFAVGVEV